MSCPPPRLWGFSGQGGCPWSVWLRHFSCLSVYVLGQKHRDLQCSVDTASRRSSLITWNITEPVGHPEAVSRRNWICQSEFTKRSGLQTRIRALALLLQELLSCGSWTITFHLYYPFLRPLLHSVLSSPCLPSVLQFRQNVLALGEVAHLVDTSSCGLKGHSFNSQSGHIPRVRVWFPVGAHARGTQLTFPSVSLRLPSPSLESMGSGWGFKKKSRIFFKNR